MIEKGRITKPEELPYPPRYFILEEYIKHFPRIEKQIQRYRRTKSRKDRQKLINSIQMLRNFIFSKWYKMPDKEKKEYRRKLFKDWFSAVKREYRNFKDVYPTIEHFIDSPYVPSLKDYQMSKFSKLLEKNVEKLKDKMWDKYDRIFERERKKWETILSERDIERIANRKFIEYIHNRISDHYSKLFKRTGIRPKLKL